MARENQYDVILSSILDLSITQRTTLGRKVELPVLDFSSSNSMCNALYLLEK
jgi:hypothetical protein